MTSVIQGKLYEVTLDGEHVATPWFFEDAYPNQGPFDALVHVGLPYRVRARCGDESVDLGFETAFVGSGNVVTLDLAYGSFQTSDGDIHKISLHPHTSC